MLPANRPPTHPREILLEDFLGPLKLTQLALSEKTRMPIQRINTLVNGKRRMTAETAVLLSRALHTDPAFWMALQTQYDLWHAERKLKAPRRAHG